VIGAGAGAAAAAPGEVVLEAANRAFRVRADRGSTLRETFLRHGRADAEAPVQALRDVSLHVRRGETVGIAGRNGAGKSSTLRVLAGIIPLDSGRAECGGRVVSLLELGAGFGRDFSGRENVELNGALHGLTKAEVAERMEAIVAFSELGDFIDVPVKTYSSGMYLRLGFAIAAHLDADVLLIDEVLAVGDEAFQRKCLRRISEQIAAGTTLVLVSHDPGTIERVCERVVVLDGGEKVFDGQTAEGLLFYHRLMGTEHDEGELARPAAGARALSVTGIEIRDGEDARRVVFHAGSALRIALSLAAAASADPPVRAPRLVLEVRDSEGHRVFRTETEPALEDGRAELVFDIERLALLGGDYDLSVAAFDGPADLAGGGFDRTVRFSVAREPGGEGVADLRGSWSRSAAGART
jgi:ABC-type polysaccharide/polyol phosphate transport system ATPase subunit